MTAAMANMLRDLSVNGPMTSWDLDVRRYGSATKSALFKCGYVSRHTPKTASPMRIYTITEAGAAALQEQRK